VSVLLKLTFAFPVVLLFVLGEVLATCRWA
jgi:hypothetical protein